MNKLQLVRISHTVRVSFSTVKTGLPARINFELVSPVNHFGAQFLKPMKKTKKLSHFSVRIKSL